MDKSGKWAVVSGASSGIGAAASRALAEDGWNLVPAAGNPRDDGRAVLRGSRAGRGGGTIPVDAATARP